MTMNETVVIGHDSYQGKPVISINWENSDRYSFSFGVGKAKLLQAALRMEPDFLDIFIEENDGRK